MNFQTFVEIANEEPVFQTGLLLAGDVNPDYVRKQLSLWAKSGRVIQLRRGLYTLAPPYQRIRPHPFLVANRLVSDSYVSCHSALAHYGLIPEYVPVMISVTTSRPGRWSTPLGVYEFRHIQPDFFFGYQQLDLGQGLKAFIATPEKAFLDLVYLQPAGDSPAYLQELRLQHFDLFDLAELRRQAERAGKPKLLRAVAWVVDQAGREAEEYESL
jgi:predicted transcriptional regulator of viral defense system